MLGSGNFGDKSPSRFLKIWSYPCFTRAILKLSEMRSDNLSQIALLSMWLLMQKYLTCFSRQNCTKMKFCIKDFLSKCDQIQQSAVDLVTYTKEILNGKLCFLCRTKKFHDIYTVF